MDILCDTYQDEQVQNSCDSIQSLEATADANVSLCMSPQLTLNTQKNEDYVTLKRPRTYAGDPVCVMCGSSYDNRQTTLKRTDNGNNDGELKLSTHENPKKLYGNAELTRESTLFGMNENIPDLSRPTSPVFKGISASSVSSFNSLSPPMLAKCADVISTPSPMRLSSLQSPVRMPPPQSASMFINFNEQDIEINVAEDATTSSLQISKVLSLSPLLL